MNLWFFDYLITQSLIAALSGDDACDMPGIESKLLHNVTDAQQGWKPQFCLQKLSAVPVHEDTDWIIGGCRELLVPWPLLHC